MSAGTQKRKDTELHKALHSSRRAFIGIGVFSAIINLLMLTGPLYMLQVYDRVLLSRSMSTLVALSILMAGLYSFMGLLELIRTRVLVRIGNKVEEELSERTFDIWVTQGRYAQKGAHGRPLDNLDTLKTFLSGPAPGALFDIPWAPIFIAAIWMLHWTLGLAALIGAIFIFIVAFLNEFTTNTSLKKSRELHAQNRIIAENAHRQSDAILAMGMGKNILARWQNIRSAGAKLHTSGSDRAGGYTALTKAFRMFLQSAILGLGCALAVVQIITPGAMIAGSIIMGRALAPIQMAIGQWKGVLHARQAYNHLNRFYETMPEVAETFELPEPTGHILVDQIFAAPPGVEKAVLQNVSFELKPGQGLAVIGPSASGKSTLARLLVGIWSPQRGAVRLDGATYDQWNRDTLGRYIGYLPQDVELFEGTIKENIARFDPEASDEAIVQAARHAGVHDMVLQMEKGYETTIGPGHHVLSGGQIQRIALARALFGDPKLVVLDEPNANLDTDGDKALTAAIAGIRQRGNTVIVMTHRPSALAAVDTLLVLKDGTIEELGQKDEVLKKLRAKNTPQNQPQMSVRKIKRKPA
jgi:PrtD family type I secretion system ABC transporter